MKTFIFVVALNVSLAFAASAGTPEQNNTEADGILITEFLLSNLQNSQTLRVENSSQGCFHSRSDTMEINQRDARLKSKDGYLPVYGLTNSQITAIDKHLYFIGHNGGEGGCTTRQNVKLSIIENGQVIKSNEFSHSWCRYTNDWRNYDAEDRAIDFSDLAYQIKQLSEAKLTEAHE